MYQPRIFCIKLQLHFGGDIHEISVPAYNGAEPTVGDLMNIVEHDFRVPRVLQNLVFHGQELHPYPNEPLSRFGIKNLGAIRLVGRMAPADMITQINSQYNLNSYQQSQPQQQQQTIAATFHTTEQSLPYYSEQCQFQEKSSVGTQYDPPPATPQNSERPPSTANRSQSSEQNNDEQQKPPATPLSTNNE